MSNSYMGERFSFEQAEQHAAVIRYELQAFERPSAYEYEFAFGSAHEKLKLLEEQTDRSITEMMEITVQEHERAVEDADLSDESAEAFAKAHDDLQFWINLVDVLPIINTDRANNIYTLMLESPSRHSLAEQAAENLDAFPFEDTEKYLPLWRLAFSHRRYAVRYAGLNMYAEYLMKHQHNIQPELATRLRIITNAARENREK